MNVEQATQRQMPGLRPPRRFEAPAPSASMALTVEMSVLSLHAGAAMLWVAGGTCVARGRRLDLAAGLHDHLCGQPHGAISGDSEGSRLLRTSSSVDACPIATTLAAQLGMQNMYVLALDDGSALWACLAWIDLPWPMLHKEAHALMRLTGQTVNEQRRAQACAERATFARRSARGALPS